MLRTAEGISQLLYEHTDMPSVSIKPTKNDHKLLIVPVFLCLQLVLKICTMTSKLLILHLKFLKLQSHSFP
jgi:hypothetical protein